ncbi:MAG: sporulation protein [Gammaproteobacteria bacterium]|nr:MAG: sporulation protein [Gammaproteobacteria bacterium]
MLLSFAVGIFVMFLIHLNDNVKPDIKKETKKVEKQSSSNKHIEPTFEFYTLLPETEIIVEQVEAPEKIIITSTAPKKEVTKSEDKIAYLLQAGSFRNSSDAEERKVLLAFLGIESKIQKVTIDNKDTWHRIQIGPLRGREKADEVKKQLQKNKIDSLLVRVKHG